MTLCASLTVPSAKTSGGVYEQDRSLNILPRPPATASVGSYRGCGFHAAGMRCLAVDRTGHPELLKQADRIVTSVTIEAIEELARNTR